MAESNLNRRIRSACACVQRIEKKDLDWAAINHWPSMPTSNEQNGTIPLNLPQLYGLCLMYTAKERPFGLADIQRLFAAKALHCSWHQVQSLLSYFSEMRLLQLSHIINRQWSYIFAKPEHVLATIEHNIKSHNIICLSD